MGLRSWVKRRMGQGGPLIPVVRLHGVIAADQRPGRLNIEMAAPLLKRAFALKSAPAVAIVINSPGGSAVQSRLISKRIRDLADETGKKVLVFVEDAAASGGFGFVEALKKVGVDRRVHTSGRNKSTMDPFLPEKAEDVARIKAMEADVHQVFIDWVKGRRGDRLKGGDDLLFTGEFWSGVKGLELGLVDGLGDMHEVLRTRYGDKLELVAIAPRRGLLAMPRLGFAALAGDIAAQVEDRATWSRLGL